MRFGDPHALWLLLSVPILAVYGATWRFRGLARLEFSSFRLFPVTSIERRPFSYWIPTALRVLSLGLLVLALARPQTGRSREEALVPVTDIVLCLDTSTSMQALDFAPNNRLDAAKDAVRNFIQSRRHDRIGLVVFSGLAFAQCPLTLDYDALLGFLDRVRIGMIQEDGTAIGTAIATAGNRLKDSAAKSKVIVLLTDGRNNSGEVDPVTAAKAVAALGIKIHTVGAGKPGGALFPVPDPLGGTRLVQLPEELDETVLREVAEVGGGRYFRATDLESLQRIYGEIDRLEKTEVRLETFAEYEDVYFPFALAGFLLFSTEVFLSQTLFRRFP
jgi:Ca-activated chloride channel homolog